MFVVVLLVSWFAALSGWWIMTRVFKQADADKLKQRLSGETKATKSKSKQPEVKLFATEDKSTGRMVLNLLKRLDLLSKMEKALEQSGLRWKVARLMHTCLALFLFGFGAGWVMLPHTVRWFAVAIGAALALIPVWFVFNRKASRLLKFEAQFPEALEFVARSMRAGHAFSVSLEMLHKEFSDPCGSEFRRTFEEHNLGLPLETALQKLALRVPSLDVHFFVSAVMLQKRTGGNLAEILDKLAYTIRERFKLRGKIRAISAHGKVTGLALTLIPGGVAVLLCVVNPSYAMFFINEEAGRLMAMGAIGLQVMGYFVIQWIVTIEV